MCLLVLMSPCLRKLLISKEFLFRWRIYVKIDSWKSLSLSESIPNAEPTTRPCSNMLSTKDNLNLGGDEKEHDKEILIYFKKSKSRYKKDLTLEIPRESEPMMAPNLHETSPEPSNADLLVALGK